MQVKFNTVANNPQGRGKSSALLTFFKHANKKSSDDDPATLEIGDEAEVTLQLLAVDFEGFESDYLSPSASCLPELPTPPL
ncbi:hypothetical protein Hamer_G012110 [Homarus americanus]|uniref:Uncharacterized protein n=1 Tax=Homarus americanus TaxID=6706 RepID=A0A8J5MLN3_HOMAM|nr:hypothetical protein Hamer_G012110 [Homarus americanus]